MKLPEYISEFMDDEGVEFFNSQKDFKTAWNNINNGELVLFVSSRLNVDENLLRYVCALQANTVRPLMTDKRSVDFIDFLVANKGVKVKGYEKYLHDAQIAYSDVYKSSYVVSSAAYASCACGGSYASAADASSTAAENRIANQKETAEICKTHLTKVVFEILGI